MRVDPSLIGEWLTLCTTTPDFIENYNRLRGTRISFAMPHRTPFEKLIDDATGHVPTPKNDPRELAAFVDFCTDLFQRLPPLETQAA